MTNLELLAEATTVVFVAGPQDPVTITPCGRTFDDPEQREVLVQQGDLVWRGRRAEWQSALRAADETIRIRRLLDQRGRIRDELLNIRRVLVKMAPEFSVERTGWMPASMLDWLEEMAFRSPEDDGDAVRHAAEEAVRDEMMQRCCTRCEAIPYALEAATDDAVRALLTRWRDIAWPENEGPFDVDDGSR